MSSMLYIRDQERDVDLEEAQNNSINAILNDPRVTKQFVWKILRDVEYQSYGLKITTTGAANLFDY